MFPPFITLTIVQMTMIYVIFKAILYRFSCLEGSLLLSISMYLFDFQQVLSSYNLITK